jgi:hypothetical protein
MKYQRPAASPFQIHNSEVTMIKPYLVNFR